MEPNEFKCAVCGGIFSLIRNEEWSEEKALKEFKENFPECSLENHDVVCGDCWRIVGPDHE